MDTYSKSILKNTTNEINLVNLQTMILNHITTYKYSNIDYFNKNFDYSQYPNFEYTINQINKKRYGFCMDLNYVFSIFLTSQNYQNYLVKCHKPNSRSEAKDIFHLSIIVVLDDLKYFVDIGYGDYFDKPIQLNNYEIYYDFEKFKKRNYYNEYFIRTNKELLKIIDIPVTLEEMKHNYIKFFRSKQGDIEINRYLFERIYHPYLQKYINPKTVASL